MATLLHGAEGHDGVSVEKRVKISFISAVKNSSKNKNGLTREAVQFNEVDSFFATVPASASF